MFVFWGSPDAVLGCMEGPPNCSLHQSPSLLDRVLQEIVDISTPPGCSYPSSTQGSKVLPFLLGSFKADLKEITENCVFVWSWLRFGKFPGACWGRNFGGKETEVLPRWTSDTLVSLISCSSVNLSFGCLRHLQRRSSPLQFWSHYDLWRETRLRNAENNVLKYRTQF